MKQVPDSRGLEDLGERGCLTAVSSYDFCIPAYENKLFLQSSD